MIFQLLPSELKHHIAELSSANSLASLARTHSSYRLESEQALYRTLSVLTCEDESLRCLETLSTNPEKAAYVRSLSMELNPKKATRSNKIKGLNLRAMSHLLKGLINMHYLSHL